MRFFLAILLALLHPLTAQGTRAEYQRFLAYADTIRPLAPGIASDIHWLPNSNRFWYTRSQNPPNRPIPSPHGKSELFIRNFNVWLRAKDAPPSAAPLSTDGSKGNYYRLPMQPLSPDEAKIAAFRLRPGQNRKIYYVESSPAGQIQPKPKDVLYSKPCDALHILQPVLFHLATRKQFEIPNTLFPNPYSLFPIVWRKDSRAFTFGYNQRGHQAFRVIVNEESSTFFCYYGKKFLLNITPPKL